jgi:hypothetical protein
VEVPEGGELPAALDLPAADAPRGAGR